MHPRDLVDQLSGDLLRDMDQHLLTLYTIARFLPAKVAVEIGTDDGSSTIPLLLGMMENDGVLYSIDPAPCGIAKDRVNAAAMDLRWRFINKRSADAVQDVPPLIDLLFIDGDHSAGGVRADWENYSPLVRRNGLVLFHDAMNQKEFPGIYTLIETDIRPNWGEYECCTLPFGWGLTIVRRVGGLD